MRENKKSVLVINGPNLNLLGTREPHVYGHDTLDDVVERAKKQAHSLDAHIDFFQSNTEGFIIDRIQESRTDGTDGIVINPGGLTHTSVALRDALLAVDIPFIELHVTNPHSREQFRHHSYLSDKANAIIVGCGTRGYQYAIDHVIHSFPSRST